MLKQLTGAWQLEPVLAPGSGARVQGTRLCYCHDVRPKGLPPGVQYVPGMSGAVRAAIAKEVQQMCEKVSYVADKVGSHHKGEVIGNRTMGIGRRCAVVCQSRSATHLPCSERP
jgi:hypothetical protein